MTESKTINKQMTVQGVLEGWPQTARVFLDRRMACVGCPIALFETVEEVARIYEQETERLLADLREHAGGTGSG